MRWPPAASRPPSIGGWSAYSYTLAASTGEPLLFVGDYFTCTDLDSAL